MAKVVIGLLVAVVLVLLYRGMQREKIDVAAPVSNSKITAVLHAFKQPCDAVGSFFPIGKSADGNYDGYFASCNDGGRYLYFQDITHGKVSAVSCEKEAFKYGYRCPD